MQPKRMSNQPNLFQQHRSNCPACIPEQAAIIQLLGALLLETRTVKTAVITGKEGDDEQDHA